MERFLFKFPLSRAANKRVGPQLSTSTIRNPMSKNIRFKEKFQFHQQKQRQIANKFQAMGGGCRQGWSGGHGTGKGGKNGATRASFFVLG